MQNNVSKNPKTLTPISFMIDFSGTWPLRFGHELTLPAEMKHACDMFSDFYSTEHNQRQLTWLPDQSRGELKTHFLFDKAKKDKSFMLVASAHQMAVLMLFNKRGDVTMDEILEKTNSTQNKTYMSAVVDTLLKTKLIKSDAANKTGVYTLNRGWKNNKVKVNINMPIKAAKEKEDAEIDGQIQEERKFVMQVHRLPAPICPNMPAFVPTLSFDLVFSVQVCSPIQIP